MTQDELKQAVAQAAFEYVETLLEKLNYQSADHAQGKQRETAKKPVL